MPASRIHGFARANGSWVPWLAVDEYKAMYSLFLNFMSQFPEVEHVILRTTFNIVQVPSLPCVVAGYAKFSKSAGVFLKMSIGYIRITSAHHQKTESNHAMGPVSKVVLSSILLDLGMKFINTMPHFA
jgi:hypothetical protein